MKIYLLISKIKDKVVLNGVFSSPEDANSFKEKLPVTYNEYSKEDLQKQYNFMKEYNKSEKEIKEKIEELKNQKTNIQYKIIEYQNYKNLILGGSLDG